MAMGALGARPGYLPALHTPAPEHPAQPPPHLPEHVPGTPGPVLRVPVRMCVGVPSVVLPQPHPATGMLLTTQYWLRQVGAMTSVCPHSGLQPCPAWQSPLKTGVMAFPGFPFCYFLLPWSPGGEDAKRARARAAPSLLIHSSFYTTWQHSTQIQSHKDSHSQT